MSFLANYWKAVERAVSDTGMNAGDIIVDISEVIKNTEEPDNVEFRVSDIPDHKPTPAKAGHMPYSKSDIASMETAARRVARPGQECNELEEGQTIPDDFRPIRDSMAKPTARKPTTTGKASKEDRKATRKKLKKLGRGMKVEMVVDKVKINDRVVWTESHPYG